MQARREGEAGANAQGPGDIYGARTGPTMNFFISINLKI